MKTTITKKEKAIEIMKKMDIYKPYIKSFEEREQVCFFEGFGGFWIDQEPELYAKMKADRKRTQMQSLCRYARIYRIRRTLRLFNRYRLSRRMGRFGLHPRKPSYGFCLRLEQRRRLVLRIRQHYRTELRRRYQKNCVRWNMKPYKTQAHIHSLDGKMDEIIVLEDLGNNDYIVDYKGVKCHALFNWFNCTYYADDVYSIVKEV